MPHSTALRLRQALLTSYEVRTPQMHQMLGELLAGHFPTLTPNRLRLLSFFLQGHCGPASLSKQTLHPHSYIIVLPPPHNPQTRAVMKHPKEGDVKLEEGEFAAVLDYHKYGDALALGETTPEEEVAFWQSSEMLCSVPRKRLFQLARVGKVLTFSQGQQPYSQGQLVTQKESGSGVYLVRRGEFSFVHRGEREVETCRFGEGHVFGSLELLSKCRQRVVSARCKTAVGIVYRLTEQQFQKHVKNYCLGAIKAKEGKLAKLLPPPSLTQQSQHSQPLLRPLRTKAISSTQFMRSSQLKERDSREKLEMTEKRAFPAIDLERIRNSTSMNFYSAKKDSQRIEEEGVRRWGDYIKLCREGPLKRYPLAAQRSQYTGSEFKEVKRLMGEREGRNESPVWKRDMLTSFYRQSLYDDFKRKHQ